MRISIQITSLLYVFISFFLLSLLLSCSDKDCIIISDEEVKISIVENVRFSTEEIDPTDYDAIFDLTTHYYVFDSLTNDYKGNIGASVRYKFDSMYNYSPFRNSTGIDIDSVYVNGRKLTPNTIYSSYINFLISDGWQTKMYDDNRFVNSFDIYYKFGEITKWAIYIDSLDFNFETEFYTSSPFFVNKIYPPEKESYDVDFPFEFTWDSDFESDANYYVSIRLNQYATYHKSFMNFSLGSKNKFSFNPNLIIKKKGIYSLDFNFEKVQKKYFQHKGKKILIVTIAKANYSFYNIKKN